MKIIKATTKVKRDTIQKHMVARFFKQYKKPFATALEIYKFSKQIIPTITLATIYRNLRKLILEREIVEFCLGERKTVFALQGTVHGSLVFYCEHCGNVQVFSEYTLPSLPDLQSQKSIRITQVNYLLKGLCQACK